MSSWHIRVDVFEEGGRTTAHAVLTDDEGGTLETRGRAQLLDGMPNVPEIGDEVAVARSLRLLADRLLGLASDDVAGATGADSEPIDPTRPKT